MHILILAVGRCRDRSLQGLFDDYVGRLPWPLALKEVEERRALPAEQRMQKEADLLLQAIPDDAVVVALDQRGRSLTSEAFAARLGRWRDDGVAHIAFLIGGADGLAEAVRQRATVVLSLGAMTWPHLMVRVLLAEQLYRAHAILSGHPYHRG
ncbi:MAG: 23S rRNA (pseudouridine(1915)-N(3))-methyltransferase RlmH [Alphaproteobacteria bacterium]|nr:23S rRNA (pseudouridine(1915)-N(3))-methyltransferase RlmH [Alphaproteobacteria bacterium]